MQERLSAAYDETAPAHRLGQYNAWRIRPQKGAAADLVWISLAGEHPKAHRVLPHGEPSVSILRRRDADGAICDVSLVVCNPARQIFWYHPAPGEELISVRLKPETAAEFFQITPEEIITAPIILAPRALRDACSNSLNLAEHGGPHCIAQTLLADIFHFSTQKEISLAPEDYAADRLRQSNGVISCGALACELDISERNLRRRFRNRIGISPKSYARQLRLTAASQLAEAVSKPLWAEIAAEAGFHDQAHMINEFRSMTGLTPQQLHAERRALSDFCNT